MVFGCILKNFPENIFWCLEKKKENTNPEKHKLQPRKKISNDDKSSPTTAPSIAIRDRDRRRDLGSGAISRLTLREIAPSIAISIRCDLAKARSRSAAQSREGEIAINGDWNVCRRDRHRRGLEIAIARARSLSLSLIFRKYFEGKIEV